MNITLRLSDVVKTVGGANDREDTIQSYMSECGYTKEEATREYNNMIKFENEQ